MDVVKRAKQLEEQAFLTNRSLFPRLYAFTDIIDDFYNLHRPTSHDYESRRDLIRILNLIAKEAYGNEKVCPTVEPFGSFLMDMFSSQSDLDLSINFNDNASVVSRQRQTKTLRRFGQKFNNLQRKGHVTKVDAILSARVPVLKVTDCGTGIECDISVENRDGIAKSQIVFMISAIDERFQKLCFMVKAWAKSQGINSSKEGTLNSLSLIALVAFHFQRRDPPILPPFSEIFKDGTDPPTVNNAIPKFLNYGRRNNESLAELFVTFLIRLDSVRTLWDVGLCASAYEASWIHKTFSKKIGCITVEDFTVRSLNLARALSPPKMKKINQCIHNSVLHIHAFLDGTLDRSQLMDKLFGTDQDVESKSVRKFDSIESKKPPAGAVKWKRLKKVNPSTTPSGSGIRYDSLNTSNGSGNPIFSSNRDENKKGIGRMPPAMNAIPYGNRWATANSLHTMPLPSSTFLQTNPPLVPAPSLMNPSPSAYHPNMMMPRYVNHHGAPNRYSRQVNSEYSPWNHNQ
ncbi:HESO1-like protein [Drosera capensis]